MQKQQKQNNKQVLSILGLHKRNNMFIYNDMDIF